MEVADTTEVEEAITEAVVITVAMGTTAADGAITAVTATTVAGVGITTIMAGFAVTVHQLSASFRRLRKQL